MYPFDYHRPTTLEEASAILGRAEDAKVVAGGMTLLPSMKLRLAQPSDLVDLSAVPHLKGVCEEDGKVVVGAMGTHTEVDESGVIRRRIPALSRLAAGIGDAQVRNRGTLGGAVANNDPAADYPAALLALGAEVRTNRRRIAADAFFTDMFETALEDDEIVTAVAFPIPEAAAYAKFPNPASRYAIVGVMVARTKEGVRVAVTGAAPCVFRAAEMEEALSRDFSASALDGVAVSSGALNADLHASAEYRAHLVTVMARRAVAACA